MKTADRWSFGANVNYKLTDWLKLSAGYSLLDDHYYKLNDSGKKYADYWGLRHRFNVSATASQSFGNLTLSLRERWQYTYRPETTVQRYYTANGTEADEHTYSGKGKNVWRNRLQAKYKLSNMFRPYANVETYMSNGWDKIRYAVGTELRLNKQHSFDIKYMYQHPFGQDDTDANRHILGLGYTYKF
jgi:long-subunit fatty acid transport protein